jgi:aminopeptidase N
LLQPQFRRLGWNAKPADSANDALLRGKILGALGYFGDQSVIADAKSRFTSFLANAESLAPDLRPAVFTIAGRYADKKTWDSLHSFARDAKGSEERELAYYAMSGALAADLARATLDISLTDETVPHEAADLVTYVARTENNNQLALDFAKAHLKELLNKVDFYARNSYLPSVYKSFSDEAHAAELEKFVKANVSEEASIKAAETAEAIRFKANLKRRELPALHGWLTRNSQDKP